MMKRGRKWWMIGGAFALLLVLAGWFAHRSLRSHGHPGLPTFVRQWWNNYPKSFAVEPATIEITVEADELERLEKVVKAARERGVITGEGNGYVKARFRSGGKSWTGKLRIKGKLTDHVEGKKWSFRVVAKKDGGFLGMERFSLQHPGTRNYLTDWFYHQLSAGEGIIALRYGFCKVTFNGDDLGVYAYEEHFAPELLENNARLKGPILRFDPALFWVHRLSMMKGEQFDEAYGEYQAAAVDAFGSKELAADPDQLRYFEEAVALLDGFRKGQLSTSQVFDVAKLARRHALVDLVGGHHSMDWSDVKFYFDPVTRRLEPISYESFSAFPTTELAGAYLCSGEVAESDDLHAQFFKDPVFFTAYVRELERMSQKHYLDSTFAAIKAPLDTASAILYGEFPYKELDRGIYYRNQQAIRRLLDVPKPFHAHMHGRSGDTLEIACVPINSLPMQVGPLVLSNGREVLPIGEAFVPCREKGKVGLPMVVRYLVPDTGRATSLANLVLKAHIPGALKEMRVDVFPYADPDEDVVNDQLLRLTPNVADFDFLTVDGTDRTVRCKPGRWKIDHHLVIPAGYRFIVNGGTSFWLENGAWIISYSPVQWEGTDLDEGSIGVYGSGGRGVMVIDAKGDSRFAFVHGTEFVLHRSNASFFQGRAGRLRIFSSAVHLDKFNMESTGDHDMVKASYASIEWKRSSLYQGAQDGMVLNGCQVRLSEMRIGEVKGVALKAGAGSDVRMVQVRVQDVGQAIEIKENSSLNWTDGSMERVERAVEAGKNELRYGPVRVVLEHVTLTGVKGSFKCGAGSSIVVDGKEVGRNKKKGT